MNRSFFPKFVTTFSSVLMLGALAGLASTQAYGIDDNNAGEKATVEELNVAVQQLDLRIGQNTTGIETNAGNIDLNAEAIATINAALGALGTSYDYRDYVGPGNVNKVFSSKGPASCATTEIRRTTRTAGGDGSTDVEMIRERRDAGNSICQYDVFKFKETDQARVLLGKSRFEPFNTTQLRFTDVVAEPVPFLASSMRMGAAFGSGSETTRSYAFGPVEQGTMVITHTLVGLEDVTVPAGSYAGCLKINQTRASTHFGVGLAFTNWYCPGIGLTKRVFHNIGGPTGYTLMLTEYQQL